MLHLGRSDFYGRASTDDLQRIMEAEGRYRDMFTNEASDALPSLTLTQTERLEFLRQLNAAGNVVAFIPGRLLEFSSSRRDET